MAIRNAHLLVNSRRDQANTLRPRQIQKVPEAAQKPDAPLISTHAKVIEFDIDESCFLLEGVHGLGGCALEDSCQR